MEDPQQDARTIIESLCMKPHPEGGWYVESYRAPSAPGVRSPASTIYFLLQAGERSHWHTVDAIEVWLWHLGSPLRLHVSEDGQSTTTVTLGNDILQAEQLQAAVPQGAWQSAECPGGWSLVSCVVAPAFEYAGFILAPPGWAPRISG